MVTALGLVVGGEAWVCSIRDQSRMLDQSGMLWEVGDDVRCGWIWLVTGDDCRKTGYRQFGASHRLWAVGMWL